MGFVRQQKALPPLVRKELVIKQKFHVCCAKGNPWISEDVDTVSIRDLDNIPLAIPRTFENVLQLSIEGEESGNVSADRYVIVSTEYPLSSATAHFISFCRENIPYFFQ